jgi:hypothetical protein
MAPPGDPLAPSERRAILRGLLDGLLARKPRGWSVVMGTGELVLRPPDRARGKFGIRFSGDQLWIAFFALPLNRWCASRYVEWNPNAAEELMSWALAVCPELERAARNDDREVDAHPR